MTSSNALLKERKKEHNEKVSCIREQIWASSLIGTFQSQAYWYIDDPWSHTTHLIFLICIEGLTE